MSDIKIFREDCIYSLDNDSEILLPRTTTGWKSVLTFEGRQVERSLTNCTIIICSLFFNMTSGFADYVQVFDSNLSCRALLENNIAFY